MTLHFPGLRAVALLVALVVLVGACGSSDDIGANAGADIEVDVGASPTFDGCASKGDIVDYRWVIVDPPTGNEEDQDKAIRSSDAACSFTLEADMEVNEVGRWVVELTVTDADGNTDTDQMTVTVIG